jgi:outer membrane scaffolding protein for murein synthesis (MipA/OmpV family)
MIRITFIIKISAFCLILFGIFGATQKAQAQTPSPLAEWQYSSGVQLQRLMEPSIPTWEVELGLGTQVAPIADGLARYQATPGPVIDIRYKDKFFISTGEGIGVNVLSFSHIRVGVALTYDLGRPMHEDGKALNGLGNIHPTPEVKIFSSYTLAKSFPLTLRADIRRQLGGSNGWVGDAGAYLPMPGSSERFAWFAGPSVTFGDQRYMNEFFGVSAAQAAQSDYPQYKAHTGFKSISFGVSAIWFITPHWIVDVTSSVDELLGSAAKSPITEAKTQGVVSVSALYKF